MRSELRIGILGAGQLTPARHIPGLLALPGVRIVGVCNLDGRSPPRVAREFNIPKIYGTWEYLVEDDDDRRRRHRRLALPALPGHPAALMPASTC